MIADRQLEWYPPLVSTTVTGNDRNRQAFHAQPKSGRPAAKEFRFEGKEVRISRDGERVILEPLEKPPFDVHAWRAKLDSLGAQDFLPEGLPGNHPVQPEEFGIDS